MREASGDRGPGVGEERLLAEERDVGGMEQDLQAVRLELDEPVGNEALHAGSADGAQELRRDLEHARCTLPRDVQPGVVERLFDVGRHDVVPAWLHDEGDVRVLPALHEAARLAHEGDDREEHERDREDGCVRVAPKRLDDETGTLRAPVAVEEKDRADPDDDRQDDRDDEHHDPDEVLAHEGRPRDGGEQDGPDARDGDPDERRDPRERAEGHERQEHLLALRHLAEEQDARPREGHVRDPAEDTADRGEERTEDRHVAMIAIA